MPLTPRDPPGRANRKACAYEADIGRLRAEGYSFAQIRQALADAGTVVSVSTVQREAARGASRQSPRVACPPVVMSTALQRTSQPPTADARSGQDIAEAFVRHRITNPLLREAPR